MQREPRVLRHLFPRLLRSRRHALQRKHLLPRPRAHRHTGFGNLPICIAKTQYSFSTDPQLRGAPTGHVFNVRDVYLNAGAGFMVVLSGEIMTMPGLPRVPAANSIDLTEDGRITGLF